MAKAEVDAMIEGIRKQLADSGANLEGMNLDDLRDAMMHPKAGPIVAEIMGREGSSVQVGDAAPDFDLARLDNREERVRLSDHSGRPVALVFGSYT